MQGNKKPEESKTSLPPAMEAKKFKKGYTPWNKGKKMPKTNKGDATVAKQPVADEETVKIRIVKEEKPLPPKDFEGKLEDVKERTAITFIRSVAARKPKVIEIDHEKYVHGDVFAEQTLKLQNARNTISDYEDLSKEMSRSVDSLCTTMETYRDVFEETKEKLSVWRAVAIAALGVLIATSALLVYNVNWHSAKLHSLSEAPAVEVLGGDTNS